MRERLRFVGIGLCGAVAATAAFGAEITVSGRQGHSTTAVVGAEGGRETTISDWQSRNQQARSRLTGEGQRVSPWSFRYGSGSSYRPGMVDRGTFRYRIEEFRKRRYNSLRSLSHRGRFEGRRQRYSSASGYTRNSRLIRPRYPSTIRYGFQRARP